jgi:hypothetical protein
MKNTFLGRLFHSTPPKETEQKSSSSAPVPVVRDLPAGTDYKQEALRRTKQEAPIGDRVAQTLLNQYPALEWHIEKFRTSYQEFANTGVTPKDGYYAFRHLYFETRGKSNDSISDNLAEIFPKPQMPATIASVFGTFTREEVQTLAEDLRRDGIIELNRRLAPEKTTELAAAVGFLDLDATPASEADPRPLLSVPEPELLRMPIVNQIAADPLFYFLTSEYFECEPVLLSTAAWFSRPHNNSYENLDNTAQLFHVDMSVPKFLQAFLYLNDVGENDGPHCLIPGTHREKLEAVWRDGRIKDDEMVNYYPSTSWRRAVGPAGSCFIVDTKAFHRGTAPVSGMRKAAIFAYTNTLFGEHLALEPGAPRFNPGDFGSQTADFSPRFFSRFAMGSK